ncbi:hypothetical protein NX722_18265 [Endozoicomonas gorgoniicola]|uniref:Uncharacterized protein n=1 Tax=Endozoicomonas gorgoniicola TaxID=1234144 RepID=A0ABT3MYS6_9GAMM|nr:hypothetical protein [Endozoicomonas gorgoniicola]MCW7554532.1 hypothetical protein [Endozoicomonas gorgoniicola]
MIASISEQALTAVYLYRASAMNCGFDVNMLKKEGKKTGISPMAIISLGSHLVKILPTSPDPKIRQSHERAFNQANSMLPNVNWTDLMISRKVVV